jgi:hypothetical protein
MQPTVLTWNAGTTTSIAPIQNVAANQPLILNATKVYLNQSSNPQGSVVVNQGFVRVVSITSATTDLSGSMVTVNGVDATGAAISQMITGPAAASTVYTTTLFKIVTSITCAIAAVGISAGTELNPAGAAQVGQSEYLILDYNLHNYSASVGVTVITNTFNYTLHKSLDKPYLINQVYGTVSSNPHIGDILVNTNTTAATTTQMVPLTSDTSVNTVPASAQTLVSPVTITWMTVAAATTSPGSATFTLLQQGVTSA